jgi:GNAT superfamily N-acetyltransferase
MTEGNWVVRALRADEKAAWAPLWRGYQQFYGVEIPEEVSDLTWVRFHDPAEPMFVLGAFADGSGVGPSGAASASGEGAPRLLGIVHYVLHRSCWTAGPYCYLQDLFTVPESRGQGVGRGLIEAVYAKAAEAGASRVWWLTQETNYAGRMLYDRVADRPGFIQYRKLL